MECIICAYKFNSTDRLPALTECDHNNICSFCFLRMRALQKNFSCPTCKRDLEHVICCEKKDATFGEFTMWGDSIGEDFLLDQKSRMFLPKKYTKNIVGPLWVCKCNTCPQVRRDLSSLRKHLSAEHNLQLCLLCAENKQAFPSEQKIYTQAQYEKHLRKGDGDGSSGHPNCEFCRKRFYDSTALFVHLNKDHYTCHLCDKVGIKFKYYNNYKDLESHYRKDHYLCEERACLEKQFMAYANEIDLAAHNMTWHPSLQHLGRRSIPVGFKSRRDEQLEQPNRSSGGSNRNSDPQSEEPATGGGARFEGGLGGRAVEGEWQVELQPLGAAGDPRDPLRNLSTGAVDNGPYMQPSEEFPALMSSAAPVGSFYSGITTNKWVGIGGSGQAGKGKKSDFPELKGGAGGKTKLSAEERQNLGLPAKKGQGQAIGNVSNITSEYAQASSSGSSAQQHQMGGSLSNWANVKVDKRLQKSKASKAIAANGGEILVGSSSSSAQNSGPTPGFVSSAPRAVLASGVSSAAPSSDQESYDLAMALSASMAIASSNSAVDEQKWTPPAAGNWQKVEATKPPLPPSAPIRVPPPPSSEEAFPTLLGQNAEQSSRQTPQPVTKGKGSAGLKVNHNMLAMTSMLKAAGVSGTSANKTASKLSVVKQPKKVTSSGYVGGSGGSSSSSDSAWSAAPPPPGPSLSSMTSIGKRSNDNLSGLGATDNNSYKAGGSTVGWAKIGGAGK